MSDHRAFRESFGDIPVIESPYCPDGTMFLIDADGLHLVVPLVLTRRQRIARRIRQAWRRARRVLR